MKIPSVIVQGDTVTWFEPSTSDALGNSISSPDWALTWNFAGPTSGFAITGTALNGGWQMSIPASQTANLTAGQKPGYYWQAVASKSGQVITIGNGRLTVTASLSGAASGYEGRSQAEIDLAAVESAIRDRVSGGGVAEYWIGSRRLRNEPMAELLALKSHLSLIVARERRAQSIANGLGDPRNTFVRFG